VSGLAVAVRALGLAASAAAAGCGGPAVTLTIDGDREVPGELDALCVGVADHALDGGSFGRTYRLEGRLDRLPQTLAVEAGGASSALAWARGYRGGVVVAGDVANLDFDDDVTLRLDRCPRAHAGEIVEVAATAMPASKLVTSTGQGGTLALALTAGGVAVIDDAGQALGETPLDGVTGDAMLAFDADGDCDDDLALPAASGTTLWLREGRDFVAGPGLPGAAVMVALDVDRDGDQDLVGGAGAALTLYENDGAGGFAPNPGGIAGGAFSDVRALAAGDVDGDGNADLIVGQNGAPPVALVGDASGTGVLSAASGVFPPVALDVRGLAPADVDGDLDLDLVVALESAAVRIYINRDGRLEDQSFVRLPQPAPAVVAAVAGDWDGDCVPDLILAGTSSSTLRGGADGTFASERSLVEASAAALADLDDDGDLDLLLAGPGGVRWYRR
jgi:hypothetical protein